MNLSGKPKEFELTDIEEPGDEPVKVHITPLSPDEVDKMTQAHGGLDPKKLSKFLKVAKKHGFSVSDFTKMESMTDEEKETATDTLFTMLDEAGADLSDISVKKHSAVVIHNLLTKHVVGWSGVFGDNGKPVEFSKEKRELLLTAIPATVKDQIVGAIEHLTQHGVLPGEGKSSSS